MSKAFRSIRIFSMATLVIFLALASAQQDSHLAQAAFTDSDGDGAFDIAEEVVGSDPFDAASTPEDVGTAVLLSLPLCSDGIDNDLDGLTDGDDPNCTDSDGDTASDPVETQAGSDPFDAESSVEDARIDAAIAPLNIPPFCRDGLDNDLDGLTDADDPGCALLDNDGDGFDDVAEKTYGSDPFNSASTPEHELPNAGSCEDGVDNDLDGSADSADLGCPVNDNRGDATDIATLPFSASADIFFTTLDPDEPTPTCAINGIESTVWYTFTPTENVLLIADTVDSNYDTQIGVWTESDDGLEQVACNDDFVATPTGTESIFDIPGIDTRARIAFRGAAGQTYLIQVGRYGIDEGDFNPASHLNFSLDVGVPVANDNLIDATTINALPFTDGPLDIRNATVNPDEPSSGCALGRPRATVWYTFTSQEDVDVITNTLESDFDRALTVWTENSAGGLNQLRCENSFFNEAFPIAFQAVAGQTYFIQVSQVGWFGPTGSDLVFSLVPESPSAAQNGDASCNGSVDAIDAALVLQFSAGLSDSVPCAEGADVNGDGDITSVDAALILQFTAGLLDSLPS